MEFVSRALFKIEELKARLATVEEERDAAQKRVQDCETRMMRYAIQLGEMQAERDAARATYTCFHCGFASADEAEATAHFGDRDEEMALCQWWKDSTDTERVQALQDAIEEQNAARAGEARAVEALRRCHEGAARQLAEPRDHDDDQYALTAIATDCEAVLADSAIALDWLAQQRREAAAEALEEFAYDADGIEELITCNIFDLRSVLRTRAAALRAGEVGDE